MILLVLAQLITVACGKLTFAPQAAIPLPSNLFDVHLTAETTSYIAFEPQISCLRHYIDIGGSDTTCDLPLECGKPTWQTISSSWFGLKVEGVCYGDFPTAPHTCSSYLCNPIEKHSYYEVSPTMLSFKAPDRPLTTNITVLGSIPIVLTQGGHYQPAFCKWQEGRSRIVQYVVERDHDNQDMDCLDWVRPSKEMCVKQYPWHWVFVELSTEDDSDRGPPNPYKTPDMVETLPDSVFTFYYHLTHALSAKLDICNITIHTEGTNVLVNRLKEEYCNAFQQPRPPNAKFFDGTYLWTKSDLIPTATVHGYDFEKYCIPTSTAFRSPVTKWVMSATRDAIQALIHAATTVMRYFITFEAETFRAHLIETFGILLYINQEVPIVESICLAIPLFARYHLHWALVIVISLTAGFILRAYRLP